MDIFATAERSSLLVRHRVHPAFRGLVAGIVGYSEHSDRPVVRRQVAGSLIPLVLSSGPTLEVVDSQASAIFGSFVAGFMPRYVTTTFQSRQHCIQIYLTPLGACRLLRIPGSELSARVVDLCDVAPAFGYPFVDEVWSAPTWTHRFTLIDRLLLSLLERASEPDRCVTWVWGEIQQSGGRARIGDLVQQTGWSHRYVVAHFTEQVGLGPKLASSIVRFEHAVSSLARRPAADVAAQLGFADQSHLARDFQRFAGWTPSTVQRANPRTAYSAIGSDPPADRRRTTDGP